MAMEPDHIPFVVGYLKDLAVHLRDAAEVVKWLAEDDPGCAQTLLALGHQRMLDLATPLGVQVQAFRNGLADAHNEATD